MTEDSLMARLLCEFFAVLLYAYYDRVDMEKLHPDNLTGLKLDYIFSWTMPVITPRPDYFSRN